MIVNKESKPKAVFVLTTIKDIRKEFDYSAEKRRRAEACEWSIVSSENTNDSDDLRMSFDYTSYWKNKDNFVFSVESKKQITKSKKQSVIEVLPKRRVQNALKGAKAAKWEEIDDTQDIPFISARELCMRLSKVREGIYVRTAQIRNYAKKLGIRRVWKGWRTLYTKDEAQAIEQKYVEADEWFAECFAEYDDVSIKEIADRYAYSVSYVRKLLNRHCYEHCRWVSEDKGKGYVAVYAWERALTRCG